ncbi:MAG: amidohydrolase family protein [Thaumarchaeota archaeon]|nr:amidohydrolase family protein [Nitrososphaerota archaeon]
MIPTATIAGKIIDAHSHVGRFGSWANVSCSASELLEQMDDFNVESSLLFALDNELVRRAIRDHPGRFTGYVWPNPHDRGALSLVRRAVKEWGFKGIKLHPLIHAFLPTDEEVLPIVEFAEKERIPVAIHSGHPPFSLPWSIGELAEMYPKVTVVMLHMGHAHGVYMQAAINTAKRYDNIILETSGVSMHSKIREAVEKVGEERVVFGSDYPFHDYSVELQKVVAARLSRHQLDLVLYENAKKFLV